MNIVYESRAIQHCQKLCHSIGGSSGEKIKKFTFCPIDPPMVHTSYGWDQPKIIFFNYVI